MVETMGERDKGDSDWCLKGLEKICNKNILLILDEVQWNRRIGKFLHLNIQELNLISFLLQKVLRRLSYRSFINEQKKVRSCIPGSHGSTYAGSPLATTVGNAFRSSFKSFLSNVTKLSNYFFKELNKIKMNIQI